MRNKSKKNSSFNNAKNDDTKRHVSPTPNIGAMKRQSTVIFNFYVVDIARQSKTIQKEAKDSFQPYIEYWTLTSMK